MTKEELRKQTENIIRAEQEKKQRLQNNELLDDSSEIYYYGNRTYPGMVINGVIYPAIVRDNYRYPACLVKGKLIEGKYDARNDKILCYLKKKESPVLVRSKSFEAIAPPRSNRSLNLKPSKSLKKVVKIPEDVRYQTGMKMQVMEINAFKPTRKFGIRAGTWARVYLSRAISSSEPADVELELLEDVVGLYRTLPAGTIFFTRHKVNPVSQRLDMDVIFMVLPDGQEMQISATIHSSGGSAGLAGAVITHSDTVAQASIRQNILAGTQEAIVRSAINNPIAAVAGDVTEDVIESQKQALPTVPQFSVQLSPQEGLIRFRRSF